MPDTYQKLHEMFGEVKPAFAVQEDPGDVLESWETRIQLKQQMIQNAHWKNIIAIFRLINVIN